jgi:hypothetical protein
MRVGSKAKLPMEYAKLFPDLSFDHWVDLWELGYDDKYGDDDSVYHAHMHAVHSAPDFATLLGELKRFFEWKDRIKVRWEAKVDAICEVDWNRMKANASLPDVWENGAVYNVFLLHVATQGARPLIDQHAWRGYCFLRRRETRCEFPTYQASAAKCYEEYENWFRAAVATGIKPRKMDKALMAFGQFCGSFKNLIDAYQSQ